MQVEGLELPTPADALALRARALETVLALARIAATAGRVEDLAQRAVEAVQAYTGAPGVCVFRYDEPARRFVPIAQQGFDPSRFPLALPADGSLTGLAAARGHTLTSSDIAGDDRLEPQTQAQLASLGFVEGASVPILHQGRVLGTLNLLYKSGTRLGGEERRILEAMAGTIGVAMAQRQAAGEQAQLEQQARRAQQLESLGVLAAGIAHDFNNLLVGILGNVDLARDDAVAAGMKDTVVLLDDALRATERTRGLVRQLLTFSRGGVPVKQVVASLREVVEDAARFALHGTSVKCELAVEGEIGVVEIDPIQVAQVVQNLVLNAAQASAPGATVSVRLDRRALPAAEPPLAAGAWVRLRVSDRGRGIPAEGLPRIFEPFFSMRPGGTGLGLAVCHSIVQKHGGSIEVRSSPGQGSTFTVHLPVGAAALRTPVPVHAPPLGGGRALVMDDEADVRAVARRMLERLGFEVAECSQGAEALELARDAAGKRRPFDVALLDVTVVGGAGGLEIARQLRTVSPPTRIVLSTGYSGTEALGAPLAAGADGLLDKPYRSDRLAAVLARVLDSPASPIYHLAPLSELRAGRSGSRYFPVRFQEDGFVHCTGDLATSIAVANDYFGSLEEPLVVLQLDATRLSAPVRFETPAPIPGGGTTHLESAPRFPHVYGPLELAAVTGAAVLPRDADRYAAPAAFLPLADVLPPEPTAAGAPEAAPLDGG